MNFGEQGQYLTDLTFFLVKRALKLFNVKWEGARCPGNVFFPEKTVCKKTFRNNQIKTFKNIF